MAVFYWFLLRIKKLKQGNYNVLSSNLDFISQHSAFIFCNSEKFSQNSGHLAIVYFYSPRNKKLKCNSDFLSQKSDFFLTSQISDFFLAIGNLYLVIIIFTFFSEFWVYILQFRVFSHYSYLFYVTFDQFNASFLSKKY